jgi:hypothetical protein
VSTNFFIIIIASSAKQCGFIIKGKKKIKMWYQLFLKIIIIIIISQNGLKFMITTNNENQYDTPPNSLRNPNVDPIMK